MLNISSAAHVLYHIIFGFKLSSYLSSKQVQRFYTPIMIGGLYLEISKELEPRIVLFTKLILDMFNDLWILLYKIKQK